MLGIRVTYSFILGYPEKRACRGGQNFFTKLAREGSLLIGRGDARLRGQIGDELLGGCDRWDVVYPKRLEVVRGGVLEDVCYLSVSARLRGWID